ncbi:MAG: acetoacetyl-CoA synthetase, partial [bacterium]
MDWLASERSVCTETYAELWRWSVRDIEGFWASIAEYFDVRFVQAPRAVL